MVLLRKNAVCAIVWVVSEVSWAFFCTLWDFSSLTSDQPEPLSVEAQSPNRWVAREFPGLFFFNETFSWKKNWQTKPWLLELEHLPNMF